jgi:predicted nucleic acid-binding protein
VIASFDTNILVYAVGRTDLPRRKRAREVLERGIRAGTSVLTLQSLAEFGHVAVRKLGVPPDAARRRIETWASVLPVHPADPGDPGAALEAARDHRLAFWDAMLWATARRVGVRYLLTEDFQDGRTIGGVRFVNPFDAANDALVDRVLPA